MAELDDLMHELMARQKIETLMREIRTKLSELQEVRKITRSAQEVRSLLQRSPIGVEKVEGASF